MSKGAMADLLPMIPEASAGDDTSPAVSPVASSRFPAINGSAGASSGGSSAGSSGCAAPSGNGPFCYSTKPIHMVIQNKLTAAVMASRSPPRDVAADGTCVGSVTPRPTSCTRPVAAVSIGDHRPVTAPLPPVAPASRFRQHRIAGLVHPYPLQSPPMDGQADDLLGGERKAVGQVRTPALPLSPKPVVASRGDFVEGAAEAGPQNNGIDSQHPFSSEAQEAVSEATQTEHAALEESGPPHSSDLAGDHKKPRGSTFAVPTHVTISSAATDDEGTKRFKSVPPHRWSAAPSDHRSTDAVDDEDEEAEDDEGTDAHLDDKQRQLHQGKQGKHGIKVDPGEALSTPKAKAYLEQLLRSDLDEDFFVSPEASGALEGGHAFPLITVKNPSAVHERPSSQGAGDTRNQSLTSNLMSEQAGDDLFASSGEGGAGRGHIAEGIRSLSTTAPPGCLPPPTRIQYSASPNSTSSIHDEAPSIPTQTLVVNKSPLQTGSSGAGMLEIIPTVTRRELDFASIISRTMSMNQKVKQLVFPAEINSGIPFVDQNEWLDGEGTATTGGSSGPLSSASAERYTMSFQMRADIRMKDTLFRNAAAACTVATDRSSRESISGPFRDCTITFQSIGSSQDPETIEGFSALVSNSSVVLARELPIPTTSTMSKFKRNAGRQTIAFEGIVDFVNPSAHEVQLHIIDHVNHSAFLRTRLLDASRLVITFQTPEASRLLAAVSSHAMQRIRAIKDANKKTLTIVHFNDVYNLIARESRESPVAGGAARFHTKLQELREFDNPLVLFSGDFMGPSLMSVDMKGKQMVDFFNQCGVHYGCFGNHEFDYGLKALHEVIQGFTLGAHVFTGSTTKWIMSNMFEPNGLPVCGASTKELVTWNGVRVGLIGLCEDWLNGCSQLSPGEVHYVDMFSVGESLALEMKQQGAEIVIALSHCRLPNDKEIMRRCPSIDLLLGGHDHWYKCVPGYRIIKSGEEFQYLSEIRVEITSSGAPMSANSRSSRMSVSGMDATSGSPSSTVMMSSISDLSSPCAFGNNTAFGNSWSGSISSVHFHVVAHPIHWDITESAAMLKMITRYQTKLDERMGGVIGKTPVPLDPREVTCRFREGLLTGFVCDVICQEMREKMMHVDFAVLGGAAFSGKATIPSGPLTMGHIFDLFPNDTRVMCMRMAGKTVRKMLKVMVRECPQEMPSFPHCSADLSFTISLIGGPPAKVSDITIKGESLDDERMYVVGVEDFAGKGNGKYKFLRTEAELLVEEESAAQVVFWLIDYFTRKKGQSHVSDKALEEEAAQAQIQQGKKAKKNKKGKRRTDSPMLMSVMEAHPPRFILPLRQFRPVEFAATLDSGTLARVYAATNLLTEDVETETNMSVVERVVTKLLKCLACRVYLFDHTSSQLRAMVGAYGSHAMAPQTAADSTSLAGISVRYKCVVNTKNAQKDPSFRASADGSPLLKVMTMLTFPIFYRKTCLGVVQAINKEEMPEEQRPKDWGYSAGAFSESSGSSESSDGSRGSASENSTDEQGSDASPKRKKRVVQPRFTEEDQGLALLLSKQIGMQLHFSNMYQRIQRSELATKNLLEMARLLGRAQKDDSVQQMVLRITEVGKQLIGCDRCSLFLIDKGEMWTVVKSKDLTDNITIRLPLGRGVAGHVGQTGQMMNIQNAYESPHFNPEADRRTGYNTRTMLAVPMLSENKESILGVLQLINKNDGTVFNSSDEELAVNFVNLAAIAVHNSFEIETLRVGRDESTLQVLPVHDLNRIRFKGGWLTVRRCLRAIINMRKQASSLSMPLIGATGASNSPVAGGRPTSAGQTHPSAAAFSLNHASSVKSNNSNPQSSTAATEALAAAPGRSFLSFTASSLVPHGRPSRAVSHAPPNNMSTNPGLQSPGPIGDLHNTLSSQARAAAEKQSITQALMDFNVHRDWTV